MKGAQATSTGPPFRHRSHRHERLHPARLRDIQAARGDRDQGGGLLPRDCGSTNGTFLNGTRLDKKPVPLADKDVVGFARYEFAFLQPASLYSMLTGVKPASRAVIIGVARVPCADCSHTGQYAAHPKRPYALADGPILGFQTTCQARLPNPGPAGAWVRTPVCPWTREKETTRSLILRADGSTGQRSTEPPHPRSSSCRTASPNVCSRYGFLT
ncbi:MAG: FHA domain-containing protein [Desulfobacterales bacterium]|nr:FHA domain-containing protein [Desulfobacterales bacterium]